MFSLRIAELPKAAQRRTSSGRELIVPMKGLPRLLQGMLDRWLERDPAGRGQRLHWQEIDEFVTKEVRVGGTPGKFSHSWKGGSLPEPVED